LARERVALDREVLPGDVTRPRAEMDDVLRVVITIDDTFAGVDGGATLRVDDADLTGLTSRILVGDPLHDFLRTQTLFEKCYRLRPVRSIGRRLCGHGAHARLRVWHCSASAERARLHADAEIAGCRIERDDRKGREPRVSLPRAKSSGHFLRHAGRRRH